MLAVPDAERIYDLSSLRLCVSAGEALPAELFQRWRQRFGAEILDGIGLTEILHIFISNHPAAVKPGSTGVLVPRYEAKLTELQGAVVSIGEIGNLMTKGESICSCYWNQHDKTKQTINVRGASIMSDDDLRSRIEKLEKQVGMLEDVHAIRRLHHLYGYFLDKCMYDEVVDCYAEDCEFYFFGGVFRGTAGIRRAYCDGFRRRFTGGKNGPVFGFLLDHPMMQDVVDVAADRKTAKARFRCMMIAGTHYERDPRPSGVSRQWWEGALYENSYVHIDSVWKIKTLNYRPVWHATHESGWAYTPPHFVPNLTTIFPDDPYGPDELTDIKPLLWPDHEVLAFHCEHPVTGRPIITPAPGLKTDGE